MGSQRCSGLDRWSLTAIVITTLTVLAAPASLTGQNTGRVEGTVTKELDGMPVGNVRVEVAGTSIATVTGPDGQYVLPRVPAGSQVILFRWLGYRPQQGMVTVRSGQTHTVDVVLQAQVVQLGEIIVQGASKVPERIVEAPAAIAVISPTELRTKSITGQAPSALQQVPGVEIVQSGVNDFNVNARGFNSSLNRRVLVLQDGRDLAIAFLGSQEWNGMSIPLEDISKMEMVRGPGSALYGANAFSGVINISTPPARDVAGTKITLGGGELSTFRGDLRHAGASVDGRFGYRFNIGYYRSDSWTQSRTARDGSDALAEYENADEPITVGVPSCQTLGPNCLSYELVPLSGQQADATTGVVSGDPDAIQNVYGSGRFDYYLDDGSLFTAEGGATQVENELFVTGIGRVQVPKALKPWARLAWASDNYSLTGWYTGRNSIDPQVSLGTGLDLEETSAIFHVEGQYNRSFSEDQYRIVLGASFRNYNVDTKGTLMMPVNDDRSDTYRSAYGQLEVRPIPELRIVGAARVDGGTLFETQFSPKGAIVYSPTPDHSFRATVNRAFQTPNYSEFFLRVQAGATPNPGALEQALEGYYALLQNPADPTQGGVGPQLAGAMSTLGLPSDIPWDFDALTPVLALGNSSLDVEKVTGIEIGYKGTISDRAYVSVDLYQNDLSNFVTDLLFGVNPDQYPAFNLEAGTNAAADLAAIDALLATVGLPADHPLRAGNADLAAGYQTLANTPGLTDFAGSEGFGRVVALSYAQAGEVQERGVEIGFGYGFTPEIRLDASYTYFDFEIQDAGLQTAGQQIVPNTARHKGGASLQYTGQQGFDAGVSVKLTEGYAWNAGVFSGDIPSSQMVDLNAGYRVGNNLRLYGVVTNLLDEDQFQIFGGSIIGRRVLGGMTATF